MTATANDDHFGSLYHIALRFGLRSRWNSFKLLHTTEGGGVAA